MKHQNAIEVLQDKIIYLTGQIAISMPDEIHFETLKNWSKEMEELKTAQDILRKEV